MEWWRSKTNPGIEGGGVRVNKIDKWVILNWIIPSIVAGIISYYTAKNFDIIHGTLMLILRDIKKLFAI